MPRADQIENIHGKLEQELRAKFQKEAERELTAKRKTFDHECAARLQELEQERRHLEAARASLSAEIESRRRVLFGVQERQHSGGVLSCSVQGAGSP